MAPRNDMAVEPPRTDILAANPSKVSNSRQRSRGKAAQKLADRITVSTRPRPRLRENGLLDASPEHAPGHLAYIAQRNAVESPLLRLCGEIKNCIWKYALGGEIIQPRPPMTHVELEKVDGLTLECEAAICRQRGIRPLHVPSALRAILTCRQIYEEMSAYVYQLNTFRFTDCCIIEDTPGTVAFYDVIPWDRWIAKVLPGRRDLVTSIELDCDALDCYYASDIRAKDAFPNLKRIHITSIPMKANSDAEQDVYSQQDEVTKNMKAKEGEDVQIIVHEVDHTRDLEIMYLLRESSFEEDGVRISVRNQQRWRRIKAGRGLDSVNEGWRPGPPDAFNKFPWHMTRLQILRSAICDDDEVPGLTYDVEWSETDIGFLSEFARDAYGEADYATLSAIAFANEDLDLGLDVHAMVSAMRPE